MATRSIDYPVLHFESPNGTKVNMVIDEYNNLYYNRIESDGTNLGWNSADRNLKAGDIQSNKLEDYLTKSDAEQIYVKTANLETSINNLLKNYVTTDQLPELTGLDQYLKISDASDTYATKQQLDDIGLPVNGSKLVKGVSDIDGNQYYPDKYGIIDISTIIQKAINNEIVNGGDDDNNDLTKTLVWSGTTKGDGSIEELTLDKDVIGDGDLEGHYKGLSFNLGIKATKYSGGTPSGVTNLGIINGSATPIPGYYIVNKSYPINIPLSSLPVGGTPVQVNLTGNGESYPNTDPKLYKAPYLIIRREATGVLEVSSHRGQTFTSDMSVGAYYDPYFTSVSLYNSSAVDNTLANGTVLWQGISPSINESSISLDSKVYADYTNIGSGLIVQLSKYLSLNWDTSSASNTTIDPDDDTVSSGTYLMTDDVLGGHLLAIDKNKLTSTLVIPIKNTPIKEASKGVGILNFVKESPSLTFTANTVNLNSLIGSFDNQTLGNGEAFFNIESIKTYSGTPTGDNLIIL